MYQAHFTYSAEKTDVGQDNAYTTADVCSEVFTSFTRKETVEGVDSILQTNRDVIRHNRFRGQEVLQD